MENPIEMDGVATMGLKLTRGVLPKIGVFSPQIINFNRGFHCKPSILGYHYFWKHPYTQ